MLQSAPTTISSSSARSTDPYQTEAAGPRVTLPTTVAPGATQASGWIRGTLGPSDAIRACIGPPSEHPTRDDCLSSAIMARLLSANIDKTSFRLRGRELRDRVLPGRARSA